MKESNSDFYERIMREHPGVFRADSSTLFCLYCDKSVSAKQMCQVTQHIKTTVHKRSAERKKMQPGGSNQTLLLTSFATDPSRDVGKFTMDLASCFTKANIPFYKLRDPEVKRFLQKHTTYTVAFNETLRTKCLPAIYNDCVDKMKKIAFGRQIFS